MMFKKSIVLLLICLFTFSTTVFAESTKSTQTSDQFIIVNKKTNQLAFYEKGELLQVFSVATGRQADYTPEGVFKIIFKVKNPWYKDLVPGGSSKNPLGYRWMGLNVPGTSGGTYGIHGNNNEDSIGTYASAGCVRMHNDEDIWLYDRVKMNTPVVITNTTKSFTEIATTNGYKLVTPEVITVNLTLTTTFKTYLNTFTNGEYVPTTNTIAAGQKLNVFEQAGSWYHVHSDKGDRWVSNLTVLEGVSNKTAQTLSLTKTTTLYTSPSAFAEDRGELSPQKVQVTEQISDWYKINTDNGERWVYLPDPYATQKDALRLLSLSFA
jgi:hypothetical protein